MKTAFLITLPLYITLSAVTKSIWKTLARTTYTERLATLETIADMAVIRVALH